MFPSRNTKAYKAVIITLKTFEFQILMGKLMCLGPSVNITTTIIHLPCLELEPVQAVGKGACDDNRILGMASISRCMCEHHVFYVCKWKQSERGKVSEEESLFAGTTSLSMLTVNRLEPARFPNSAHALKCNKFIVRHMQKKQPLPEFTMNLSSYCSAPFYFLFFLPAT